MRSSIRHGISRTPLLLATLFAAALLAMGPAQVLALPPTPADAIVANSPLAPLACSPDVFEDDGTSLKASTLAADGQWVSHTFDTPLDVDVMKIQAGVGRFYTIRTGNLAAGTDTFMFLYNEAGARIGFSDDINETACQAGALQSCASSITWLATYTGLYFAEVLNLGKNGACPAYDVRADEKTLWLPLIARDLLPPATPTPTNTATATPSPTPTATQTATPTQTSSPTPTPTITPTPSRTPTPSPTGSPTPTPTPGTPPAYPVIVPLPSGAVPNGLAVDPVSGNIYVSGRNANRLYMIDGRTFTVIDSAPVGGQPWGVAVWREKAYVANFSSSSISVLRTGTLAPVATIPVSGRPTFIKTNPVTDHVIAVTYGDGMGGGNRVIVINPANDTIEADVDVGGGGAWGLAIDTDLNHVYVSTRDSGTISAFDGNNGYQRFDGQSNACGESNSSPYSMDFDPILDKLYLACARYDNVDRAVIFGASGGGLVRQAIVPIGNGGANGGGGVAADSATGHVFFTNSQENSVSVINGQTNAVIATVPAGVHPYGAAVNPLTQQAFIGNGISNNIYVLLDAYP